MGYKAPIGISNKHLHLSQEHVEVLFGQGHELTIKKELKQPGQYAMEEVVDIVGPKGTIKNVRVLGPVRPETQVELSLTDARGVGVSVPIKESGDLAGTPGIKLVGPAGEVELEKGVIAAFRHIHIGTKEAIEAGVKDKDLIKIKIDGPRGLVFDNVLVRTADSFIAEIHLDTDEANAAGIGNDAIAELLK